MQIPGYQIVRKINQGGMSTVYLAIQLSVGREVALKVMSPALNADPVFSERFQREANIVGQLSHPNIISIYDIGCYKNLNYIAMDYLSGGSLHDRMRQGLSTQEALRICREVAQALDHAHDKGYMHRDIKPENILFREDGSAVLSDFGVAKTMSSASRMTHTGTVVGTPHYMSPEQAKGKTSDGRADIYGLGIVLYEMLTGSVPYKAEEAVAIAIKHLTAPIPTLPAQYSLYQNLLNKMLAKETDDRLQRGQDVVEAINGLENRGVNTSGVYLTATDPTAVQIYSLLRALLLTSGSAFVAVIKQALQPRLRWSRARGFYLKPRQTIHEIRTFAHTDESNFPTMVSPSYQLDEPKAKKTRPLTWRLLFLSTLLALIWLVSAIGITRGNLEIKPDLPTFIPKLAKATHDFILPEPEKLVPKQDSRPISAMATSTSKPSEELAATITPVKASAKSEPKTKMDTQAEATTGAVEKADTLTATALFSLNIDSRPHNTQVRILNIKQKFHQGIALPPGNYQLELSAPGYKKALRWIRIEGQDRRLSYALKKQHYAGQEFSDRLNQNQDGPKMVVVPAGEFTMGSDRYDNAKPLRVIKIRQPFAVGKFEISFNDYDLYAQAKGLGRPSDKRWGYGERPAIHVSWQDAQNYVQWLKLKTGKPYRLLSEAEWEYAARAGSQSAFWWGEENKGVSANCQRGCNSEYTTLFRSKTAPIGRFKNNGFGLYDTAGNVAEWVSDCYQDHYLGLPRDGSSVNRQNCDARVVRGGSMMDKVNALSSAARTGLPAQSKLKYIGFRVALDLD